MSANNARISATLESSQWDLAITRVFDVPRELVFKAWTDAKHVAQWWGPKGFTNPVCEMDVRRGGTIRIHMRAPDGVVYPMSAVIEEIVEPERLVFVTSALDDKGNSMFDVQTTVMFAEQQGKTKLTLEARVVRTTAVAPQYLQGMEAGWSQSLDRLAAHLQSAAAATIPQADRKGMHLARKPGETADREIVGSRLFDAPRELVWKMWTDPHHLVRWFGPNGFTTTIQQIDVRAGGVWRQIMHGPDGRDYRNHVIYLEVVEPERLVYEHRPDAGSEPVRFQTTVTFADKDGKTEVEVRMLFPTAEERDRNIKTYGAVEGLNQTFGRLAETLAIESATQGNKSGR